jgi:hypothetical protein
MTRAELVETMAIEALYRRGFCYYTDPMEGGQNAYDLSCEAREEAEAMLDHLKEIGMAVVPREPTNAMREKARSVRISNARFGDETDADEYYRAMIAASPAEASNE